MDKNKIMLSLLGALVVESALIVFTLNYSKTGNATFFGLNSNVLSNISFIIILIFILTLVSIVISLRFMNSTERTGRSGEMTKLSSEYLSRSLMHNRSKQEIKNDLIDSGYSKEEVGAFLSDWESREPRLKNH